MNLEPIEYRPSKARNAFLLLGSAVLTAVAIWMAFDAGSSKEDRLFGMGGAVLFGLAFFVVLYGTIRPRSYLSLGQDRIEAYGLSGKKILELPYGEIVDLRIVKRGRTRFVVFIPKDPNYGLDKMSGTAQRALKVNAAMFGSNFIVTPSMYSVKPQTLADEIGRRVTATNATDGAYPRPFVT